MHDKLNEVALENGEPAPSFVARMAAHYGLASAREFTADFDLNYNRIVSGHPIELEKLATLTGCNLEQLLRVTPRTDVSGWVKVGSEMIATKFSRRKALYICPDCWSEDVAQAPLTLPEAAAFVRLHWVFTPIRTCAKHSRPLVLLKNAPANYYLYDTALMAIDLPLQLPQLLASEVRRQESSFENYVSARLYGEPRSGGQLDQLRLSEAISICGHIGRALLRYSERLSQLSDEQTYSTYDAGFRVLSKGRKALAHAFLQILKERPETLPVTIGPQNIVGRTYSTLLADFAGRKRYEPIYHDVANAIYDVMPWGPSDPPLFGVPITYRRYYSAAGAGRVFGFATRTIDKYAQAAGIALIFGSNKQRRRILIDAKAADQIFDAESGHIPEKHLSQFGLTLTQRRALIDAGLLRTVVSRDRLDDGEVPPIKVSDVANLMARFLVNAEPVEVTPPGCANLRHVSRAIQGRLPAVHDLILGGEIWVGRLASEGRPYAALVVNIEEVRARLKTEVRLSTSEMSRASGLSKGVLVALAAAGAVDHLVEKNPTTGKPQRSYSTQTAEWARRELVSLTAFGRRHRVSPKRLRHLLDQRGVAAFCSTTSTNGTVSVYRVTDIEGLDLKVISPQT